MTHLIGRAVLACIAGVAAVLVVGVGAAQATGVVPPIPVDEYVGPVAAGQRLPRTGLSASAPTPENPVWYDFYIVGLKTDNSTVYLGPDLPSVQPESISESQIRARIDQVDEYFRANTKGAVRARLAQWIPFSPFALDDVCSNLKAARQEAERRSGVTASENVVLIAATTSPCYWAGGAGFQEILLWGYLDMQTIGHEFGHSHLWLDHESYTTCGLADALTACPDYVHQGFQAYWGSSIMSSNRNRIDPLLPPDLDRLRLLTADNTVFMRDPPAEPVDIQIGALPLSNGRQVIELGPSASPFYVSMSASTNLDDTDPVVQVTQIPGAFTTGGITGGLTIVSEAGKELSVGRTHCGDSGFCVQVLSQSSAGAVVRISKRQSELPAQPGNIRTSATPEGRIALEWDAPADIPQVRGYDIRYFKALEQYASIETVHVDGSEPSWVMPYAAYDIYEFRVASDTSNGRSAFSAAVTADNRTVPSVLNPQVRPGTLGQAYIDGACDPRGYDLAEKRFYYTDDPSQPLQQWSLSSSGSLSGLRPHRQYTVQGQCRNAAGWGALGQTTFSLPDVPRQPAMTQWDVSYGPAGLYFRADHSTRNPFGDPETGIKVSLNPGGASCENHDGYGGSGGIPTACTVGGLPPGKAYTARIVLTSDIGESVPQFLQVATEALPDQVGNLRVTVDSQGHAKLTWDAASVSYGSPRISYRVTMNGTDVCVTEATFCALPAMQSGESYLFSVHARSLAGESLGGSALYFPRVSTVDPPPQSPPPNGTNKPGSGGVALSPKSQTLNRLPKQIRVGTRLRLPKSTKQGGRVRWSSATRRTCRVKSFTLIPRRTGTCRVVGVAAASGDFGALQRTFTIKVRKRAG